MAYDVLSEKSKIKIPYYWSNQEIIHRFICKTATSYTTTCLKDEECCESISLYIFLPLCLELCPLTGPPAIIMPLQTSLHCPSMEPLISMLLL